MPKISGQCLCGEIKFSADTEIKLIANCHCADCRAATGSAFGTNVFVDASAVVVTGTPKIYTHTADSGADMEKHFCSECGSQLFGRNSNRPGTLSIRAGVLAQTDLIEPVFNVYLSKKIPSTPVNPDLKGFDKMPG